MRAPLSRLVNGRLLGPLPSPAQPESATLTTRMDLKYEFIVPPLLGFSPPLPLPSSSRKRPRAAGSAPPARIRAPPPGAPACTARRFARYRRLPQTDP